MGEASTRTTHKSNKPKREAHIDVRMTAGQKAAIITAANRLALDPSTWMRSVALDQAGYDPETDAEFQRMLRARKKSKENA